MLMLKSHIILKHLVQFKLNIRKLHAFLQLLGIIRVSCSLKGQLLTCSSIEKYVV